MTKSNRGFSFLLLFIAFLVIFSTNSNSNTSIDNDIFAPEKTISSHLSYTWHGPINIQQNSDFSSQGFPGDGTEGNPYIIEGYSIISSTRCILLDGIDAHFVVRDCYFQSTSSSSAAVMITYCSNGTITQNTIVDSESTGIDITGGSNTTISKNRIMRNNGDGIRVSGSCSYEFSNNTISDNEGAAIRLFYVKTNVTIADNTLKNNGLVILGSDNLPDQHWLHEVYNNTINGLEVGYFSELHDTIIDAELYGQMILADCSNVIVRNGIFRNATRGVQFGRAFSCPLVNCTISGNTEYGYYSVSGSILENNTFINNKMGAVLERYSTVTNNTFVNNGFVMEEGSPYWEQTFLGTNRVNGKPVGYFNGLSDTVIDGNLYGQVIMTKCDNVVLRNGNFSSASRGLQVCATTNSLFDNLTIMNNEDYGVLVYGWTVTGNCSLVNSTILFNQRGILVAGPNWNVTNNTVGFNDDTGILISNSSGPDVDVNANVSNNAVFGNQGNGIEVRNCYECTVVQNTVRQNGRRGIYLAGGSNNTIYGNRIGGSIDYNAYDSLGPNYWDDGISIGNSWDDYGGTGTYPIPGSAGSIDNYPLYYNMTPTIAPVSDIQYNESSTGNQILWQAFDDNPEKYTIYLDGKMIKSGIWNSSSEIISISIDGLDLGEYYCSLIVYNIFDEIASDQVLVAVVDGSKPMIDSPIDISYDEFDTGYSITWNPSDDHPVRYIIYLESNIVKTGAWNSSTESISISVDGLGYGVYMYTLSVIDAGGNVANDIVWVDVTDGTAPIIDNPSDITYDEFDTGQSITWNPTDLHPASYIIYLEDNPVKSGAWNSSTEAISISVDGHGLGDYNYTIVVTDIGGNVAIDEVNVNVSDGTAPVIDNPSDIYYAESGTGYSITWNPTDLHPVSYTIYLEDSPIKSGVWNSSAETISISADGHILGDYNYTLVVTDIGGNIANDTVWVSVVNDTINPIINSPSDISYDEFATGFSITWNVSDMYPVSYAIYCEGNLTKSDVWKRGTESIAISVDGHALGDYNYTLVVTDIGGNLANDTVWVTVIDGTAPVINTPLDIIYVEFSSGHVINWHATDLHPFSYIIYLDETPVLSGSWNSSTETISISVDGHALGDYNYTIVVVDVGGNIASDQVFVWVIEDTTSPIIDSPLDIFYTEFTTNNSISWHPSDLYPGTYTIYLEDSPIKSGVWNSSAETISISVDGHAPGEYNYTIVVTDIGGNSASDSVLVTVIEAEIPTTTTTIIVTTDTTITTPITDSNSTSSTTNTGLGDISVLVYIISIGSTVVIIVIIILIFRNSKT